MNRDVFHDLYRNNPSFVILFDSLNRPLTRRNFLFKKSRKQYQIANTLQEEVKIRTTKLLARSKKSKFDFFNDEVARLNSWKYLNKTLHLTFSSTNYFDFASLNAGLDDELYSTNNDLTLRELLREDIKSLSKSVLPNPLSVNLSMVLVNESKIVISLHSKKNFEATGQYTTPIGGTVSLTEGDCGNTGIPDPFKTAQREAHEEMGLNIKTDSMRITGLGRDQLNLKPQLYGYVKMSISSKELLDAWRSSKHVDETDVMLFYDFDDKKLLQILQKDRWSGVGRAATISAILATAT